VAVRNKNYDTISLWLAEWDNGWKDWDHKEDIEDGHLEVMYFCYPDPIPKAYENLIEAKKITDKSSNDNSLMDVLIHDFYAGDKFETGNYFSVRTVRCLRAEGVTTINQLLSWCEHQLMKTPNLGKKSLTEIKTLLALKNLKLAKNPTYKLENGYSKCQNCSRVS
jgi:DNA-directed RNA polymerase alpha subunit